MTMAWTKTLALGLVLGPLACVITVDGDPNDGFGGNGGSFGGSAGAAGSAGSSGASGEAGSGGTATLSPTCDAEPGDENDPCTQCMKQNCCDAWRACNDETCVAEWGDVAECVLMEEFADSETLGECISQSSAAMDDFVQQNTTELISCATASADDAGFETLCSSECFGTDIFFE